MKEEVIKMFPVAKMSSDSQDWSIPEQYDHVGYPLDLSVEQLQSVVIAIWKQYMLHDEILSAIQFLENAPYVVRHTAATEKALFLTRQCIAWMDDAATAIEKNSPEDTTREAGTPMPLPFHEGSQEANRFNLIVNHLGPAPGSILDLGSMDGGFTNRYALRGYQPIGIDLSPHSVSLANRKAVEFSTGAKFYVSYFKDLDKLGLNQKFDYITSTDTYEHIIDRVNDMLLPAKALMKDDGKFLLATPHGAWMRGKYLDWAHPWLYEKMLGCSWLEPNPRGHLIAPTIWSVAADFRAAGFYVENCFVAPCMGMKDVEGQGNIFVYATHSKILSNRLNLVFEDLCEESFALAAQGHSVTVYSLSSDAYEKVERGVNFCHANKFGNLECDVVIHKSPLSGVKAKEYINITTDKDYFDRFVSFVRKMT